MLRDGPRAAGSRGPSSRSTGFWGEGRGRHAGTYFQPWKCVATDDKPQHTAANRSNHRPSRLPEARRLTGATRFVLLTEVVPLTPSVIRSQALLEITGKNDFVIAPSAREPGGRSLTLQPRHRATRRISSSLGFKPYAVIALESPQFAIYVQ
jgi:hypothetical protein